jgi:hypothetical protein
LNTYRLLEHVAVGHRGDASYKLARSSPSLADLLERRDGIAWSLDLCYRSHDDFDSAGFWESELSVTGHEFLGLGNEKKKKRTG